MCRSKLGCEARYLTLFELVSHMRSAHSGMVDIVCGIDGCRISFSSSFSWYYHVRRDHHSSYRAEKRARSVRDSFADCYEESDADHRNEAETGCNDESEAEMEHDYGNNSCLSDNDETV